MDSGANNGKSHCIESNARIGVGRKLLRLSFILTATNDGSANNFARSVPSFLYTPSLHLSTKVINLLPHPGTREMIRSPMPLSARYVGGRRVHSGCIQIVNKALRRSSETYARFSTSRLQMKAPTISSSNLHLLPLVICGPSGVGKGTIINELLNKKFSSIFDFTVSHTTRQPRQGEVDGIHYHFALYEEMKKDIRDEKFIEYAEVHGNYYGTSFESVRTVQLRGKAPLLDIDVQGVRSIKESGLPANFIFIAPPSLQVLEDRLRGRGTEDETSLLRRIGNASKEIDFGLADGNFDFIVTNGELADAVYNLESLVKSLYCDIDQ